MLIAKSSRLLSWWLYRDALWRMDSNVKKVYLTFDDGPIPESTPFILKTLAEFGIKATFFVVGDNAARYPELTRQMVDEGHVIGNHTYHHLGGLKHLTSTYLSDIDKSDRVVPSRLFRPPHGIMTPWEYWRIKKTHKVVMWDVITHDYSHTATVEDIINNVKHYTRNGSIITFHDSLKSINKLHTALPISLQWLINKGYEFDVL